MCRISTLRTKLTINNDSNKKVLNVIKIIVKLITLFEIILTNNKQFNKY